MKFCIFLSHIIRLNNGAKGIIVTLTPEFISVIYDYKPIGEDYINFNCLELMEPNKCFHYFEYKLNLDTANETKEQTINAFSFSSNYKDVITLRITLDNVKKLIALLKDTKLKEVQLKAENYKPIAQLDSNNNVNVVKYKTILSIKDIGNLNEEFSSQISSNFSIFIKALKKPFMIFKRFIGEPFTKIPFTFPLLYFLCKSAVLAQLQFITLFLYMDNEQTILVLKVKDKEIKANQVTINFNENEEKKINKVFVIPTSVLSVISDKLTSLSIEDKDEYISISENYLEILCEWTCFQDLDNVRDEEFIHFNVSVPIKMIDEEEIDNYNE